MAAAVLHVFRITVHRYVLPCVLDPNAGSVVSAAATEDALSAWIEWVLPVKIVTEPDTKGWTWDSIAL